MCKDLHYNLRTTVIAFNLITEKLEAHEYREAVELMDKIMNEQPALQYALIGIKFWAILNFIDLKEAISFVENTKGKSFLSPTIISHFLSGFEGNRKKIDINLKIHAENI